MNIFYPSHSKTDYSVNAIYIKGLRENNILVTELQITKSLRNYIRVLRYYQKNKKDFDFIMVGYDSPYLVILMRLLSRKKIIYNALCSIFERLIVSRNSSSVFSLKSFYYWALDFLAVRCADLTMLESNQQIRYFKKLFKINPQKLYLAWTSADDFKFYIDDQTKKFPVFSVIFRGRFLPEAGAEYVLEAAKIMESRNDIQFILFGNGPELTRIEEKINFLHPANLKFILDKEPGIPSNEWIPLMRQCHLSLGQLSDHPRLNRTIPHKAYETIALGLPYLTAANKAILELLEDGKTCITFNSGDAEDLAKKIIWAKENPQKLKQIAESGHKLYRDNLKPQNLARNLLERIQNIIRVKITDLTS